MAQQFIPISQLAEGRDLHSTDLMVVVQDGKTVKVPGYKMRPHFIALLQGTSVVLLQEDHGLDIINSVKVVNPMGSLVEVEVRILGADLEILSNVPLDGYTLHLE